jgi:hypothetical protein
MFLDLYTNYHNFICRFLLVKSFGFIPSGGTGNIAEKSLELWLIAGIRSSLLTTLSTQDQQKLKKNTILIFDQQVL